jgi:hypothetical protein
LARRSYRWHLQKLLFIRTFYCREMMPIFLPIGAHRMDADATAATVGVQAKCAVTPCPASTPPRTIFFKNFTKRKRTQKADGWLIEKRVASSFNYNFLGTMSAQNGPLYLGFDLSTQQLKGGAT